MLWSTSAARSFLLLGVSACSSSSRARRGLFISTVSNTQQEAFMSMFLFFLPR